MLAGMAWFACSSTLAAEPFDGKSNFICATQGVMACVDGSVCKNGQARDFDMVIRAFHDGDKEVTSAIKNMQASGNQLILQGVENDHGWTAAVNRENGRMSVGVAGHEVSYSLFGACHVN